MRNELSFRRGDVVLIPFPFITDFSQSKTRPAALVIQNDVGNRVSPNLIVTAISSRVPDRVYPTNHHLRAGTAGLDRDSVVLASVILTIPKSSVLKRLGHLDEANLQAVDVCLRVSLAL
jgi:mRNA interferase MazF